MIFLSRSRHRSGPASGGFSLVEVLVALAVLAIVSVTIVGAIAAMTSRIEIDREDTQIAFLLRAIASDIRLRGIPSTPHGSFDTHPDYTWEIEVGPFKESENSGTVFAALREVRLRVASRSGRAQTARVIVR